MNKEEIHLDQLTRQLMDGTLEKPEVSLVNDIMMRIEKEKQLEKPKLQIFVTSIPKWVIGGLVICFLLNIALMCLFYFNNDGMSVIIHLITLYLPHIIVVMGIGFILFLFIQLDHWLRWKLDSKTSLYHKVNFIGR